MPTHQIQSLNPWGVAAWRHRQSPLLTCRHMNFIHLACKDLLTPTICGKHWNTPPPSPWTSSVHIALGTLCKLHLPSSCLFNLFGEH